MSKARSSIPSEDQGPTGSPMDRLVWGPDYYSGRQGDTLLAGPVVDQAALHGLPKEVRDLGMPLVSVPPAQPGQADVSEVKP